MTAGPLKFRKKPVVIEAWQVPEPVDSLVPYVEEGIALTDWCGGVWIFRETYEAVP